MQQFLLFAGSQYYACGGWCDFQSSFINIADAKGKADQLLGQGVEDWAHIVDGAAGVVVWESETRAHC